jgi:putative endonuclease
LLLNRSMTLARVALGKAGEDLACQELERRGYAVLARRYRRRGGELDIIARDGQTIVFIEVKSRSGLEFGSGAAAITALKRRRMIHVAMDYLTRYRLHGRPCRFDVVSLHAGQDGPAIEVVQNAFSVE